MICPFINCNVQINRNTPGRYRCTGCNREFVIVKGKAGLKAITAGGDPNRGSLVGTIALDRVARNLFGQ